LSGARDDWDMRIMINEKQPSRLLQAAPNDTARPGTPAGRQVSRDRRSHTMTAPLAAK